MKKIIGLLLICCFSFQLKAQDDAISKFYSKYANSSDFTSVFISSKMFSLIAKIPVDEKEKDIRDMIGKLEKVQILTSDKVDGIKLYNEAFSVLPKKIYEELMVVKEGEEEYRFLIKEAGGKIGELLMLKGGKNDFMVLNIIGDISLEDISRLSKTMEVDGFKHLDKVKERSTQH